MQYLFLAYRDRQRLDAMSTSQRDTFGRACLANDEALRESGHLLAKETLDRHNTTTVSVCNGKLFVSDGPIAETTGPLNGLFLIDARDLNEAIQVAAQMPQAHGGAIEVRPMLELTLNTHKENL
ncbi:MAG: YciI family protein [Chloroflexi bacterium]|nr:YciI family protein [Chloroflexota bacterium]